MAEAAAATAAAMVVEAQARGLRSAGGDGSRAKPRVARAARSYSLALAPPAGRGCCYGYGARALTLTNGWPRVSRTQRRFYICRDTHLSVRGREGKRERERTATAVAAATAAEGMKREEETTAGDRPLPFRHFASGLLCYSDGIMPHSSCLLGNIGSRAACLCAADEWRERFPRPRLLSRSEEAVSS